MKIEGQIPIVDILVINGRVFHTKGTLLPALVGQLATRMCKRAATGLLRNNRVYRAYFRGCLWKNLVC